MYRLGRPGAFSRNLKSRPSMRALTIALTLLTSLVFPALTLLWLHRTRARSKLLFGSVVALAAVLLISTIFSYGYWFATGMYWPLLLVAAFVWALRVRIRRGIPSTWLPIGRKREYALVVVAIALTAVAGAAIPFLVGSKSLPREALELEPPLRGGTFVVMAGGSNWSVNMHAYTSAPAMRLAVDFARLNGAGMRARGITPAGLTSYSVFGSEVIAPCGGEVTRARNDVPNSPPLAPSSTDELGNHVVIQCGDYSVVLAHLSPGTVRVNQGDMVSVGQLLGEVGSSGSVLEPHLHLQAVVGRYEGDSDLLRSGEPVPITIRGRYLIKNEWFSN